MSDNLTADDTKVHCHVCVCWGVEGGSRERGGVCV